MEIFKSLLFLLLIGIQIDRCSSHAWSEMRCSADSDQNMPEGIVKDMNRFPWLGVIQHGFKMGGKMRYAIASVVLIHPLYAVAAAEDISRIPVKMLGNNTKLFFWGRPDPTEVFQLEVKDYTLHPQFKSETTFATIALISLIEPDAHTYSSFRAPVLPVCVPLSGGNTYNEMYAIRMTDQTGKLQKEILKMDYVNSKDCEEFYFQKGLLSEKYNPVNPLCAMTTHNKSACVWDAGIALVVPQSFGFWQLIGISVRGPGCGVPTKFLNVYDYLPWINDVISNGPRSEYGDVFRMGIRRVSPIKLIMFNPEAIPPTVGNCERDERGNVLFKDWGEFTVNKDFVLGFYIVIISALQSVLCGEVTMQGANQRSNAAIWIENNCHPDVSGSFLIGQERSGDFEQITCFCFFKNTAFMEFRFTFSFQIVVSAVLFGKEEKTRERLNPTKTSQYTTPWWPTTDRLRAGYFVVEGTWWWWQ